MANSHVIRARVIPDREPNPHDQHRVYNSYRKGLVLFTLYTKDGHEKGFLYAGNSTTAKGRAEAILGSGASVEYA